MSKRQDIANDVWASRVRGLLQDGYGTEDIAIMLKCRWCDVRAEVAILREMGVLERIYQQEGTAG